MKIFTLLPLFLVTVALSFGRDDPAANYRPLDGANPILFHGDCIVYQGKKIALGAKAFFIDGQLSDAEAAKYPFVFNSINEAAKHLRDGTEAEPMTLYVAPYVYWIDDPDDPVVRASKTGGAPYGLVVNCDWLKFQGLTNDPRNVVMACARGQTQGADGNFTMFYFDGDGIGSENVTFGNYCNVDLEFPLKPALNRAKRSATVTQAQLILCNSDKVVARNTRFISRLNLCPFSGAKRALFYRCHFESTDDALCSRGVYLECTFVFFSSKPFYNTRGTGAVMLNCDFDARTQGRQYLTKVGSPVAIVDSRFKSADTALYVGWTQDPTDDLRCYQYNVTLNGAPVLIGADKPRLTVDMTGKPVLEAYRIEHDGTVLYNLYNLLRGDDDWDPMGMKPRILAIEKQTGRDLKNLPTFLRIQPAAAAVETGKATATLNAVIRRFGDADARSADIRWSVADGHDDLVAIAGENTAGPSCEIRGANQSEDTRTAIVTASTASGLEAAGVITAAPAFLPAPEFVAPPKILTASLGKLAVAYELALDGRRDESLVTWYRCADAAGRDPIEVAVSRLNDPEKSYTLSSADVGNHIMVGVAPKHLRCHPGAPKTAITQAPIAMSDVQPRDFYYTDFQNFPTKRQPRIIPGFWTIDGYKPKGLEQYEWEAPTGDTWFYGAGVDGMKGTGLVQAVKGARLLYTPVGVDYGGMSVELRVDPGKTAGQGFGSATGQFLEIYIKFDTQTLTGYGLRILRTTKYDHAVDFVLMRYEKGVATEISSPVGATCFRTGCTIKLAVKNNKFTARVETSTPLPAPSNDALSKEVDLEADIAMNAQGGLGIQHTGSVGAGATMLHALRIEWK